MTFAEMFDSTDWTAIPGTARAVAGYMDGPRSIWPQAGWNRWQATPHLVISVLADPRANTMDVEYGNAPAPAAAAAAKRHLDNGQWTVLYGNRDTVPAIASACAAAGTPLKDGTDWPAPGSYLWVADPTGVPHLLVPDMPVQPVAVQYQWAGTFDVSSCVGTFPASPPVAPSRAVPIPHGCVGMGLHPSMSGYWLAATDGGVFTHGALPFYGSLGGQRLNAPIVSITVTPDGRGYYLTAADGGVFTFGDAPYLGSME